MLYIEVIAVCSYIHTEYVNILCRQKVELLNVKLLVHIETTRLWSFDHVAPVVLWLLFLEPIMYTSNADDVYRYSTQCLVTHRHKQHSAEQSEKRARKMELLQSHMAG